MAFVNEYISDADALAYASPQPWVAHSPRAFSVPGLLLAGECAALIELAEQRGFDAASVRTVAGPQVMRNVRNNERAQFPGSASRCTRALDRGRDDQPADAAGLPDYRFEGTVS